MARKEILELAKELSRLLAVGLDHLAEGIVGQEADAIGEEAEEQPHDETSQCLVIGLRTAQIRLQLGKFIGNIGTAILSLEPPRMGRVHVIEMSSYQIDLSPSLDPSVGILLNVSEDHIDRHGTLEHYAAVKERLVAGVQQQGTAIVGVDDGFSRNTADRIEQAGRRVVRVSVKNPLPDGVYVEREIIWRAAGGARSEIARIGGIGSLRGLHNAQNAACAAACALALGVSAETLQEALRSFPGLAHRMEQVGRRGHVLFVNDSKGTNADAAAHALSSFGDIFWIAGGKPKLGGITGAREYFPRIRKAYLIGEAAQEFAGTLGSACRTRSVKRSRSRSPTPRATPRPRACPIPWCCCRRPAPRSTSTATSKSAARRSATSSPRCPASSRWCENSRLSSRTFIAVVARESG